MPCRGVSGIGSILDHSTILVRRRIQHSNSGMHVHGYRHDREQNSFARREAKGEAVHELVLRHLGQSLRIPAVRRNPGEAAAEIGEKHDGVARSPVRSKWNWHSLRLNHITEGRGWPAVDGHFHQFCVRDESHRLLVRRQKREMTTLGPCNGSRFPLTCPPQEKTGTLAFAWDLPTCAVDDSARIASRLVALVTGVASLGIGILALRETHVLVAIQRVVGTSPGAATLILGIGIVVFLCLVLVALQYWCTRTAATFAFRWGKHA